MSNTLKWFHSHTLAVTSLVASIAISKIFAQSAVALTISKKLHRPSELNTSCLSSK